MPLLRRSVADFAAAAGLPEDRLDALRLAASEAVSNVVLHAYRGEPGDVYVRGWLASDELRVLVSDNGPQTPAQQPGLGMGLPLMADASDDFSVAERAEGGTAVSLVFLLRDAEPSS